MRRQSKWVLFGKILAIVGVLVLILVVYLSVREEKTQEPLPQVKVESKKPEETEREDASEEEVPALSEPSVGEDGTIVLPFVPVE